MHGLRDSVSGMEDVGTVGDLTSARQTRKNLLLDVTDHGGFQDSLTQHLEFLDMFEQTIEHAAVHLMKSG
jgi:hypothetical protein